MTEEKLVFEQLNPDACRTYFIGSTGTREAALIDPVLGATEEYLKFLERGGWTLRYVFDTHTHADHLSGGRLLSERTGAEYAMHRKAGSRHAALRLTDGSTLTLGGTVLEVIETPGHTKDSVTLKLPGRVLTGDFLFIGGAGRTDLPGGDPGEHWESLNRVIPSLDEDTLVYPGHDYHGKRDSVLREEKRANANLEYFQSRGREEYVAWLSAMKKPTPEWMIATVRANNEGPTDPSLDFMPADAVSACMCEPAPALGLPELSVEEVGRLIASGGSSERLLLDVRQPDEYLGDLGHVPGAILIPLPQLPARLSEIEGYREKTVIAICRSGSRSAKATALLKDAGFRDVWNMTGGTLAWRANGFPVER
jgi:glyoxylase-like metal-dependent hydrolase (beta-lactamase superfamily II)/rhodanese-related sulfurtransferase